MRHVPAAYRSGFIPSDLTVDSYTGANVECMESGVVMGRVPRDAQYAGFTCPGSWGRTEGGQVNVARLLRGDSIAGLDAAVRLSFHSGSQVNMVSRNPVQITVVRTQERVGRTLRSTMIHPFIFPRHIESKGVVRSVQIASNGPWLAMGSTDTFPRLWAT